MDGDILGIFALKKRFWWFDHLVFDAIGIGNNDNSYSGKHGSADIQFKVICFIDR